MGPEGTSLPTLPAASPHRFVTPPILHRPLERPWRPTGKPDRVPRPKTRGRLAVAAGNVLQWPTARSGPLSPRLQRFAGQNSPRHRQGTRSAFF